MKLHTWVEWSTKIHTAKFQNFFIFSSIFLWIYYSHGCARTMFTFVFLLFYYILYISNELNWWSRSTGMPYAPVVTFVRVTPRPRVSSCHLLEANKSTLASQKKYRMSFPDCLLPWRKIAITPSTPSPVLCNEDSKAIIELPEKSLPGMKALWFFGISFVNSGRKRLTKHLETIL